METLTLSDMRREFGCDRILARFLEEDLKFDSFGNLGLIYTLVLTAYLRLFLGAKINASMLKTLSVRIEVRRKTKSPSALLSSQTSATSVL